MIPGVTPIGARPVPEIAGSDQADPIRVLPFGHRPSPLSARPVHDDPPVAAGGSSPGAEPPTGADPALADGADGIAFRALAAASAASAAASA